LVGIIEDGGQSNIDLFQMEKRRQELMQIQLKACKHRWPFSGIICVVISSFILSLFGCTPTAPPITPLDEFFVQNNHGLPVIPEDWTLTVDGAVANPLSLTPEDLAALPATTTMGTLECVGNLVSGQQLIGNANWTGVSIDTLVEAADPWVEAASIKFYAVDGFTCYDPYNEDGCGHYDLDVMRQRQDVLLAYQINGEVLPLEQGYPLRLVVPGSRGFQWLQWVDRVEISTDPPDYDYVFAPVHAQILDPLDGATLSTGIHSLRGMGFVGGGNEITSVQISTDEGDTWKTAVLLNYFVPNVWKHWAFTWNVQTPGVYRIYARAVDSEGVVQDEHDGSYGWQTGGITVEVE